MKIYKAQNERGQYVRIFLAPWWFTPSMALKAMNRTKYRKAIFQAIMENKAQMKERGWNFMEAIKSVGVFTPKSQFSIDPNDSTIGYVLFSDDGNEGRMDMYINLERVH